MSRAGVLEAVPKLPKLYACQGDRRVCESTLATPFIFRVFLTFSLPARLRILSGLRQLRTKA